MNTAELFPFTRELSARGRASLGALAAMKVPARRPLLARGDDAGGAYLVLTGALRVYYVTDSGREATLYRVEPGRTCVLALSATLRAQPYPAWVESAAKGASFVRVPSASFHQLVDAEPAFRGFVLAAMSERIFELMCSLEQLATATMAQRVAAHVLRHAGATGELATTQAMLASELGTAREVVFRALRELAARGAVSLGRGRIRVTDARLLEDAASGK